MLVIIQFMKPELESQLICTIMSIPEQGNNSIKAFVRNNHQDLTPQELVLVTKLGILTGKEEYELSEIGNILTSILEANRTTNKS